MSINNGFGVILVTGRSDGSMRKIPSLDAGLDNMVGAMRVMGGVVRGWEWRG